MFAALFLLLLSILLFDSGIGSPVNEKARIEKQSEQDLEKLSANAKLENIEDQLERLQQQLELLHGSQAKQAGKDKRMPVINFRKRMPVINFRDVERQDRMPLIDFRDTAAGKDVFYDNQVEPMAREAYGWQPLKRSWQPLKRVANEQTGEGNAAKFKLVLQDNKELRQELMETIENHLADDLAAAEKYGIHPQQILSHLREKNADQKS